MRPERFKVGDKVISKTGLHVGWWTVVALSEREDFVDDAMTIESAGGFRQCVYEDDYELVPSDKLSLLSFD